MQCTLCDRNIDLARDDTMYAAERMKALFSDGTQLIVMRPDSHIISRVFGSSSMPSALGECVVTNVREQLAVDATAFLDRAD